MMYRTIKHILSLALACCLLLPGLAGCSEGRGNASGSAPPTSSSSSAPSGAQSGVDDSGTDPQPEEPAPENTALLDGQPVPAFLNEDQRRLYLDALNAFVGLTLTVNDFAPEGPASSTETVERDGIRYSRSTGKYTTWEDFEAAMLAVFTPDYFAQLNDISYTGTDGVFHQRDMFIEYEGNLYFSPGARGGSILFKQQLGFREVFRSPGKIVFNVVGEYFTDPYETGPDAETYTQVNSLVLELVEGDPLAQTWRFSLFALPY